jgi:hypothetical protein
MWLLGSDPVFPAWAVLPLAVVAMVATCLHLMALQRAAMPESRRRIRTTSGVLSLVVIPATAYGFGVATTDEHRVFLLVWLAVLGLMGIVVILAGIDMFNNVRLHAAERQHIRENLRRLHAELHAARRSNRDASHQ